MKMIKIIVSSLAIACCSGLIARPLTILFVVGYFPAPSQTFILNQITGLIDRGHNVKIFSFHRTNNDFMHSDIEQYKLLDKVTYEKFSQELLDCDIIFCQFGYLARQILRLPLIKER